MEAILNYSPLHSLSELIPLSKLIFIILFVISLLMQDLDRVLTPLSILEEIPQRHIGSKVRELGSPRREREFIFIH